MLHRSAQIIATRVLERLEARKAAIERKAEEKLNAAKKLTKKILDALSTLENKHLALFSEIADKDFIAALNSAGIARVSSPLLKRTKHSMVLRQVQRAVDRRYRTCTNGSVKVKFGVVVGVTQSEYMDWNLYRGAYKGWGAKILDTTIVIRENFTKLPIKLIAGHVILDSKQLRNRLIDGAVAYTAVRIKQGRGNALYKEHGFIVFGFGLQTFAESIEQGLADLLNMRKKAA